jgi:tetratricopeptide (TPR) repeat protein
MSTTPENYTEYDWFAEARSRETTGDVAGAIDAYKKAVAINAGFGKGWYYLALALYQAGKMDEAAESAKKALDLKPDWEKHIKKNMPGLKM